MRLVLFFALIVAGCDGSGARGITYQCSHPEFSADDYDRAALSIVGNWDLNAKSQAEVDAVSARAQRMLPWADKISDPCMRLAAKKWLGYYPTWAAERLKYYRESDSEQSERERERQQEDLRQADLLGKTKLPPGPKP